MACGRAAPDNQIEAQARIVGFQLASTVSSSNAGIGMETPSNGLTGHVPIFDYEMNVGNKSKNLGVKINFTDPWQNN